MTLAAITRAGTSRDNQNGDDPSDSDRDDNGVGGDHPGCNDHRHRYHRAISTKGVKIR
jgi:hypothetical protein